MKQTYQEAPVRINMCYSSIHDILVENQGQIDKVLVRMMYEKQGDFIDKECELVFKSWTR